MVVSHSFYVIIHGRPISFSSHNGVSAAVRAILCGSKHTACLTWCQNIGMAVPRGCNAAL